MYLRIPELKIEQLKLLYVQSSTVPTTNILDGMNDYEIIDLSARIGKRELKRSQRGRHLFIGDDETKIAPSVIYLEREDDVFKQTFIESPKSKTKYIDTFCDCTNVVDVTKDRTHLKWFLVEIEMNNSEDVKFENIEEISLSEANNIVMKNGTQEEKHKVQVHLISQQKLSESSINSPAIKEYLSYVCKKFKNTAKFEAIYFVKENMDALVNVGDWIDGTTIDVVNLLSTNRNVHIGTDGYLRTSEPDKSSKRFAVSSPDGTRTPLVPSIVLKSDKCVTVIDNNENVPKIVDIHTQSQLIYEGLFHMNMQIEVNVINSTTTDEMQIVSESNTTQNSHSSEQQAESVAGDNSKTPLVVGDEMDPASLVAAEKSVPTEKLPDEQTIKDLGLDLSGLSEIVDTTINADLDSTIPPEMSFSNFRTSTPKKIVQKRKLSESSSSQHDKPKTPKLIDPFEKSNEKDLRQVLNVVGDDFEKILKEKLENTSNFEEIRVEKSLEDLKNMKAKGQLLRKVDKKKIDKYLTEIPLMDLFDEKKSSKIIVFANSAFPDKYIILEGNHRFMMLNRVQLNDVQKVHKVNILCVMLSVGEFEKTWSNSGSLIYSENFEAPGTNARLDIGKIPLNVVKRAVSSVADENTRNACTFSNFETLHAYFSLFDLIFSELERKTMGKDARFRNATKKQLEMAGLIDINSSFDVLSVYCLPIKTRIEYLDGMRGGYKFPTGINFICKLFDSASKNDTETAGTLKKLRKETEECNVGQVSAKLKLIAGVKESKETKNRKSVKQARAATDLEEVSNFEDIEEDSVVVVAKCFTEELVKLLEECKHNVFFVSNSHNTRVIGGELAKKYGFKTGCGIFTDVYAQKRPFYYVGPSVADVTDPVIQGTVFTTVASAVNKFTTSDGPIRGGCLKKLLFKKGQYPFEKIAKPSKNPSTSQNN